MQRFAIELCAWARCPAATTYNADGQVSSEATGTTLAALNAMTVLEQKTTIYSTSIGLPILESVYSGGRAATGDAEKLRQLAASAVRGRALESRHFCLTPQFRLHLGNGGSPGE